MSGDQQQTVAAVITTPSDREVRLERVFDAPRPYGVGRPLG
jgi:hypothetical protein